MISNVVSACKRPSRIASIVFDGIQTQRCTSHYGPTLALRSIQMCLFRYWHHNFTGVRVNPGLIGPVRVKLDPDNESQFHFWSSLIPTLESSQLTVGGIIFGGNIGITLVVQLASHPSQILTCITMEINGQTRICGCV